MEKLILNTKITIDRKTVINYFFDNFELNYNIGFNQKQQLIELILVDKNPIYKLNVEKIPNPTFHTYKEWKYPVFFQNKGQNNLFLNCFLLLSGIQELIPSKKDTHNRFRFKESLQYKYNFIDVPTVNIYFELVYEKAIKNGINITKKQFESPIVFTHDIDQLRSGWFEDLKYELVNFRFKSMIEIPKSIIFKLFGLKDSYHKAYKTMLELDEVNKLNSVTFFMTKKSHRDADYDITKPKFKKIVSLSKLKTQCEFHPGYDTSDNQMEFKSQIEILTQIKAEPVTKVRQHFLKYDRNNTPKIHEMNNIQQDFSLGFPEMYGFRNSIASPFYLFNFDEQKKYNTVEIPLFFMDSTLLDYIKTPIEEERIKILELAKKTVLDFNCNFSILFHNSAFSHKKYKGYISMYKKFIILSKNNGNNS